MRFRMGEGTIETIVLLCWAAGGWDNWDNCPTLDSMKSASASAIEIWTAGLDAVRAEPLVRRSIAIDGDQICIGDHVWNRGDFDRIVLVGAGKAGSAMTAGLVAAIGDWLPMTGWVNVPEGTHDIDVGSAITLHPARPAGVNEPSVDGVYGTRQILNLVSNATSRDLCIALISGGGSALLPAPIDGITLDDKLAVIRLMSGGGADITELNTVRKHLSSVKGGGLLRACRAAHLVTLILSDVIGDPLDAIASGPTVVDTSTVGDAIRLLSRFDTERKLPTRIYDALEAKTRASKTLATPTTTSTTIVIGNNAVAVDEAGIRAESLGYNHVMQVARSAEGSAEEVGRHLAKMTVEMLRRDPALHRLDCLITGGEPVVTLAPPKIRGRGGRNQQLVLAAYEMLRSMDLTDGQWQRLCILSGGTDGEDGPTDAAGAWIDATVHRRAVELNLDVADHLSCNNAYAFFHAAGGLLLTGPTGTNVCDVRVALVNRRTIETAETIETAGSRRFGSLV